ncbi:cell division protein FtsX [Erythrobacter sp. Alg231-14]|uniref:cell division protein FtsX n=1 Tax=Erythrobacter sp. Alg231-14 TaxID=1922225 RepID=UPI00307C8AC3
MTASPASEERVPNAPSMKGSASARLLPQTRFGGPIPWVIAILIALVVIAAAGGLSLRNLADNARADLSDAVTVQIVEADPQSRNAQATAAANALSSHPLVTSVRIVPEAELAELLEPWLGSSAASEDVPIPALIDVELTRQASSAEIAQLQGALDDALDQLGGAARIDAQSTWLKPVYDALAAMQYLALALIGLVAFATAAAVWLAARSAFFNHSDTVEIIHLLGGTDAQVTKIFQRSVLRDAAFGAIVGLVLGLGAVWLLGQQFAALDSGMIGGGGLGWIDWLIIACIPLAGVLLALITGRITIGFALRSML